MRVWPGGTPQPQLRRDHRPVHVSPGLHGPQVQRVRRRLLFKVFRRRTQAHVDVLNVQLWLDGHHRRDLSEGSGRRLHLQAQLLWRKVQSVCPRLLQFSILWRYKEFYKFNKKKLNIKNCLPILKACGCNTEGSQSQNCSYIGECVCIRGRGGEKCDQCAPGYYK